MPITEETRETINNFITNFNNSNKNVVTIDYAYFFEDKGKQTAVNLIYCPSILELLSQYLDQGNWLFQTYLYTQSYSSSELEKHASVRFTSNAMFQTGLYVQLIPILNLTTISLQSITEPLLSLLFLKENTIYMSVEFKNKIASIVTTLFPKAKELYSILYKSLQDLNKERQDYSFYNDKNRVFSSLERVKTLIYFYNCAINFETTGIFSKELTEHQQRTLDMLDIAATPWAYVTQCINELREKIATIDSTITPYPILIKKVLNGFITDKLCDLTISNL